MTNFAIEMRADPECRGLPKKVRVYRQFGPWLVHRAVWVQARRGRRQWVVTYSPVGRKLPKIFTLGRAVKIARECWRRGLNPSEDAERMAIREIAWRLEGRQPREVAR